MVSARCVATQLRNRGRRATLLEVGAAPLTLLVRPIFLISVVAVVINAALLLMVAAPDIKS